MDLYTPKSGYVRDSSQPGRYYWFGNGTNNDKYVLEETCEKTVEDLRQKEWAYGDQLFRAIIVGSDEEKEEKLRISELIQRIMNFHDMEAVEVPVRGRTITVERKEEDGS